MVGGGRAAQGDQPKKVACLVLSLIVGGLGNAINTLSAQATTLLNMAGAPGVSDPQELILNGTTILPASFTGFYESIPSNPNSPTHEAVNQNYFVGTGPDPDFVHNNFFVFDLSNISFPISTAVLIFGIFEYTGPPSAVYSTWDVTTPIADLEADQQQAYDIFNDLGSGVPYGSTLVGPLSVSVAVALNSNAIAALNDAEGSEFAVGGTLNATPLPASLPLFATGLGAMGLLGWRRRRKNAATIAAA